jgi:single-strand DNA-binding protein
MTTGTIKSIGDTIQVSEKFKKREFVIETEENYPQFILFELNQDRCDIIDAYQIGQKVTVEYNLKGRQWTNNQGEVKTFNTLQVWKIQPLA